MSRPRRPLLLVHGAWHGGWCWSKVVDHLAGTGHRVFTPTLTGLGERVHLLDRSVDLELHVADILGVLEYENLDDVVLCGHSYAGMVITAIADRAAHRIAALVYLDAYVPRHGECVLDIRPAAHNQTLLERVESQGNGWLMPPTSAATFGVLRAADRDWLDSFCVPMPLACFTQPVRLAHPPPECPRHYILAQRNTNTAFRTHYESFRRDPSWQVHTVDCGHEVMVDRPRWLAEKLDTIARVAA